MFSMNIKAQTMNFRVVVILLWSTIIGVLINAGQFEITVYWLFDALVLAVVFITALPFLRQVAFAQRLLPFLLLPVLFLGIAGNVYYTKDYIKRQWLYQKNTGDRLIYWFDQYAVKMNNAPFYLSMRKFMAGNSIVCSSQNLLRKYDASHISHVQSLTVENYPVAGISPEVFQKLQNDSSFTSQQLTMLKVWRENNKRKVQRIPFHFFLHKDGRRDTYYLHMVKTKNNQKSKVPQTVFIAIPKIIHDTLGFSDRS